MAIISAFILPVIQENAEIVYNPFQSMIEGQRDMDRDVEKYG